MIPAFDPLLKADRFPALTAARFVQTDFRF